MEQIHLQNPFEILFDKITELDRRLTEAHVIVPNEIIDGREMQRRLSITEPTLIRWRNKGKIPHFRIGSSVKYNWASVLRALENENGKP